MVEDENRRPKQTERILDYLDEHGAITQYEAMVDLGVMRLASRISELKKDGHPIVSRMICIKNRFGENCFVKQYTLQGGGKG